MSGQDYLQLMEKMTRKLANTFEELNQLFTQELNNLNLKVIRSQEKNQQQFDIPAESPIQIDSIEEEPAKQTKTKKIKKEGISEEDQKEAEEGRGKKKIKKVSHKPKAPASSFLLFFKQQQANISRSYPTYGVTELTKVAAKCWNELSVQQKDPYIKLCDQERRVYQQKMQRYRLEFPHEIAEKEKDRKLSKKEKKNVLKETPRKQKNDGNEIQNIIDPQEINILEQPRALLDQLLSQSNEKYERDGDDSLGMV